MGGAWKKNKGKEKHGGGGIKDRRFICGCHNMSKLRRSERKASHEARDRLTEGRGTFHGPSTLSQSDSYVDQVSRTPSYDGADAESVDSWHLELESDHPIPSLMSTGRKRKRKSEPKQARKRRYRRRDNDTPEELFKHAKRVANKHSCDLVLAIVSADPNHELAVFHTNAVDVLRTVGTTDGQRYLRTAVPFSREKADDPSASKRAAAYAASSLRKHYDPVIIHEDLTPHTHSVTMEELRPHHQYFSSFSTSAVDTLPLPPPSK